MSHVFLKGRYSHFYFLIYTHCPVVYRPSPPRAGYIYAIRIPPRWRMDWRICVKFAFRIITTRTEEPRKIRFSYSYREWILVKTTRKDDDDGEKVHEIHTLSTSLLNTGETFLFYFTLSSNILIFIPSARMELSVRHHVRTTFWLSPSNHSSNPLRRKWRKKKRWWVVHVQFILT